MTGTAVELVISINVHENPEFLRLQLDNIRRHVRLRYAVILSCNRFMADELGRQANETGVVVNPQVIEKARFTGTLLQGIVSNIQLAARTYTFRYFLVLSSRSLFIKDLTEAFIDDESVRRCTVATNFSGWHWPKFKSTELFLYYERNSGLISLGAHEGLIFSQSASESIICFLDHNDCIREDLFSCRCAVEEFALQTIIMNESADKKFWFIGSGVDTVPEPRADAGYYVYKTIREVPKASDAGGISPPP